jgi:fused-like protein
MGDQDGLPPPCSPLMLLTACCADEDPSTRKFACFAVGNAAFHSEELYAPLSCSIPLLVLAAEGEADEKTRANAAGAIGNLVRNGGTLAGEMARGGVPLTLLRAVLIETDIPTQRISLFSLGTMAVYPSCRCAHDDEINYN